MLIRFKNLNRNNKKEVIIPIIKKRNNDWFTIPIPKLSLATCSVKTPIIKANAISGIIEIKLRNIVNKIVFLYDFTKLKIFLFGVNPSSILFELSNFHYG